MDAHLPLQPFSTATCSLGLSDELCLMILNSKLTGLEAVISENWSKFGVHCCVDGGANSLYNMSGKSDTSLIPEYVCGDLDSVKEEVLDAYLKKGSKVQLLPDQDETDFTKALLYLLKLRQNGELKVCEGYDLHDCKCRQFKTVYVMNGMWGRFDHTLGNINTLFTAGSNMPIYMLSEDSLTFVLQPGTNKIRVDSGLEEGHCGLIPFGHRCESCSTVGLQWDLNNQSMEIGGLISTCNLLREVKEVTVINSNSILWTMSHNLLKYQY